MKRIFTVNGQPFFPIGGQSRNSSGYNDEESERAFQAVLAMHGNTLEIPVYWETIEPQEGQFDFTSVQYLVDRALIYGLKLILLWFGTWKNGDMDYVPGWVKTQPARFQRAISPTGRELWVLSSHCAANLEADRRAFSRLCAFLNRIDGETGTVIALQVENEPGILGSDRDYGAQAQRVFTSPVPTEVINKVASAGTGWIWTQWQKAGGKTAGSWPELFGDAAGEIMTAWSIATYIDSIVEAGKAELTLPMYVNVWLGEGGWVIPGESYPAGGAVANVVDLYRWCAPHIDLIAPDIYIADSPGYEFECVSYTRQDNPLFIPESAPGGSNSWQMWKALAKYNAIGYFFFAVEHILAPDGSIRPEARPLVESFQAAVSAIPLLLRYQGTPDLYPVIQEEGTGAQRLVFEGWWGLVEWGDSDSVFIGGRDWRHLAEYSSSVHKDIRGRGLVVQSGPDEFYLAGAAFRLFLRPQDSPAQALDAVVSRQFTLLRLAHYLSVEEGHFNQNGDFVTDRRRNGDEVDFGVWVEADCGVIRVRMVK